MKQRAVLIIHGFGGNEHEILYLYDFLREQHVDAFWIPLTGHDGVKEHFAKASYSDWLADVKRKLDVLAKDYQSVTCIGFSMGGLLSLQQSVHPVVDQVILCNTPIYLYNFPIIFYDLCSGLFKKKGETVVTYADLQRMSLKACVQFCKLLHITKKQLKTGLDESIKQNMLILQNKSDEITFYKSANYFLKHSQKKATLYLYEGGRHEIFLGKNKERAVKDILAFIETKDQQLLSD